ncbi:MAG: type III pantothenate kinase [Thermodesulfobacteriota bacterium]|nr:MAG: type III pantothenate kinase [Thermodesulfobacteriota bacterium]
MLLAVDIGNTDTVLAVFDGPSVAGHWRVPTVKKNSVATCLEFLRETLFAAGVEARDLKDVVACSVVDEVNGTFRRAVKEFTGLEARFVGEEIAPPMPVITENPAEVGADRIVNGFAAYSIFKREVIVVDFGTAITVDYITGKGEYAGGSIAPGIGISLEALVSRTSKLPDVELKKPAMVVGRNTVESMRSGFFYGFTGLVDGIIKNMIDERGGRPKVIATGGGSGLIKDSSEFIEETDEMLTMKGLKILSEGARK